MTNRWPTASRKRWCTRSNFAAAAAKIHFEICGEGGMIKLRIWVALAVTTCGLVRAQDVPPPPKPADDGPSLEATMKFIEEKLGSIGPVSFISSYHHKTDSGKDFQDNVFFEVTKARASVVDCRIDYHMRSIQFSGNEDVDIALSLKDVEEVVIQNAEQRFQEENSNWIIRTNRPVFFLENKKKTGFGPNFPLYNESLANRIAKALVHAVELCGGGSKDPF
jgi:hypothetical protein